MKQFFIVVDGIDGSGKTTQIRRLANLFEEKGRRVYLAKDPGTTSLAIQIRSLLLDRTLPMSPSVQAILYNASRLSSAEEIKYHLSEGWDVICDRWMLSTLVYQGDVQGVGWDRLIQFHREWVGLHPDVYVVLDLEPCIGMKRVGKLRPGERKSEDDRFESQGLEFSKKLRDSFLFFADYFNRLPRVLPPVVVADASGGVDETFSNVCSSLVVVPGLKEILALWNVA